MTGTASSTAKVPTAHASKYLQQLCKHWQHNLAVEYSADEGRVTFPKNVRGADWPDDAIVHFRAEAEALNVRIEASIDAQRDGLKEVVARHLDRFAFREAPLAFAWEDAAT
ncbi:DUF2218 domain-containing protein [Sphingopyxis sp. MWB1]|uniref:DUF2218 domain-containing protein n=1 Tax=Sphingopyxis sp. MWB1 TaxID=1537715 RepID=UPI00051A26E8|nr:DUF2218 domain-containing protein [Sphingopyxis sp. MWB1]